MVDTQSEELQPKLERVIWSETRKAKLMKRSKEKFYFHFLLLWKRQVNDHQLQKTLKRLIVMMMQTVGKSRRLCFAHQRRVTH